MNIDKGKFRRHFFEVLPKLSDVPYVLHEQEIDNLKDMVESLPTSYENLLGRLDDPDDRIIRFVLAQVGEMSLTEKKDTAIANNLKIAEGRAKVFYGDLSVKGDFDNEGDVYVLGNMVVDGVLFNNEYCNIFVANNLTAGSVFNSAGILVGGEMVIREILYQTYYAKADIFCCSRVKAKLIVEDETSGVITGRVEADHNFDNDQFTNFPAEAVADLKRLLVPTVFEDNSFVPYQAAKLLKKRKNISL